MFAKANSGMIPKATQGCKSVVRRVTGASASRCAVSMRERGMTRSVAGACSRSRRVKSSIARRATEEKPRAPYQGRTGVSRPTTTPATVGWTPLLYTPYQTTIAGGT